MEQEGLISLAEIKHSPLSKVTAWSQAVADGGRLAFHNICNSYTATDSVWSRQKDNISVWQTTPLPPPHLTATTPSQIHLAGWTSWASWAQNTFLWNCRLIFKKAKLNYSCPQKLITLVNSQAFSCFVATLPQNTLAKRYLTILMKDTAQKRSLMAHSLYKVCDGINTPKVRDQSYMVLVSQKNSKNLKFI